MAATPDATPDQTTGTAPPVVDWELAVATARRVAANGPHVPPEVAAEAVAELREAAGRAGAFVREVTGLDGGQGGAPLLVVDRTGWTRANVETLDRMMTPLIERLREKEKEPGTGWVAQAGAKASAVASGALLGLLSSRVLGQFDPFHDTDGAEGRLLVVAPNVIQVERELRVDPSDFRLWVCLHEETHRVQFTANPWLREHLRGELEQLVRTSDLDLRAVLERLGPVLREVVAGLRTGRDDDTPGPSLLDLLQSPEQRPVLDRVTAVMSLLEGHADVVMDEVGPAVVPSVAEIRRRFQRRRGRGGLDAVLRSVLGLEAKLRQYRDGAAFVRAVIEVVGMDGFNRVWESPETLPTPAEIGDPAQWVERVHGIA